jgi:hypothetical protein
LQNHLCFNAMGSLPLVRSPIMAVWHATEGWETPHNEELNNFYSSHYTNRMIKWTWMRWARHTECMGRRHGIWRAWGEDTAYGVHEEKTLHMACMGRRHCIWRAWGEDTAYGVHGKKRRHKIGMGKGWTRGTPLVLVTPIGVDVE